MDYAQKYWGPPERLFRAIRPGDLQDVCLEAILRLFNAHRGLVVRLFSRLFRKQDASYMEHG
jgi:hypothetical protein